MFRFLELSLHGWDLWPPVRVPLDRDVVLVTGTNGSGKTTLLDAIRQLLNAPRLSSKRRLQHYLRRPDAPALIRAVVSNEATNGASAPFRRERIATPVATLACTVAPASAGSLEKRFAILPGRAPIDDARRVLLDSRDWYGPERYSSALEHAGVTRSLMGVLAIEQGRTNSLFELRPRELFQRVIDMLGDRAVLERYREARRQYEESAREVYRQGTALQARQEDLARTLRDVARLDEWEAARDRLQELEARLPAAELQALLRERADLSAKIPELRTKVRIGEDERERFERQVRAARDREAGAGRTLESARQKEKDARERWGDAERDSGSAEARVAQLEASAREAAELPDTDLGTLERLDEEAARVVFAREQDLASAEALRTETRQRVERLRAGLPVYPEAVDRTLATLQCVGITVTLAARVIDVGQDTVATAAEAALGDARFALIVAPDHAPAVIAVARQHQFPGPVFAGATIERDEAAGPLVLARGAPVWLREWARAVELYPDGSWRDARGTWVVPAAERVLGTTAAAAALTGAERALEDAEQALTRAETAVSAAREDRTRTAASLARERHRRQLLSAAAELPAAREGRRLAESRAAEARSEHQAAAAALEAANTEQGLAAFARTTAEDSARQQASRLQGERDALTRAEEAVGPCDAKIAELRPRVSSELRARAERGELDGADTVRADLGRATAAFASLGEPPPAAVRDEARHLRANVEELEQHVGARRREADAAQKELAECRSRYLAVVTGSLVDYRRRVAEVASGANVTLEMELPRLVDDDRTLDEAQIDVRFGFDGKEPLPLGDSSFSGGQQVIAGLILLMGMAETDGQGFFMLDEPFAHLSPDRVDQVGRFLRSTGSQFIITAPTTLDRAQLDPASLVIVLQKKRPQEPHAPVPLVAEA